MFIKTDGFTPILTIKTKIIIILIVYFLGLLTGIYVTIRCREPKLIGDKADVRFTVGD